MHNVEPRCSEPHFGSLPCGAPRAVGVCIALTNYPAGKTEGGNKMAEIRIKENESLDSALKRFKRSCAKSGVLAEVRKREHYEKPSVRRKKKSEAARKRKH